MLDVSSDRPAADLTLTSLVSGSTPHAGSDGHTVVPAIDAEELQRLIEQAAAASLAQTRESTIAIIDDEELNVAAVRTHLQKAGYSRFCTTTDSTEALTLIRREQPDLILLDIMMPRVSGLDILHALALESTRQSQRSCPHVLVMTASEDARLKQICLGLGAIDFVAKPLDVPEMTARVRNTLVSKCSQDRLTSQNVALEAEVARRTAELVQSREEVVHCLARAAERRDDDTGHHVRRVGRYVGVIAKNLGLPPARVEVVELAAQLHDVGKIGIPDSILFKPGRLDEEQIAIMRRHCAVGHQIIKPACPQTEQQMRTHTRFGADLLNVRTSPLLMLASRIAQTHHERWDGSGYPLGLAGTDIPLEGRMTAVADVFDALASRRPYKDPFPRERCFEILREGRGTHFDPDCLDAFFAGSEEIVQIQLELMDDEA